MRIHNERINKDIHQLNRFTEDDHVFKNNNLYISRPINSSIHASDVVRSDDPTTAASY